MQSTGQTSTHELSFVPMHGSAMTYATAWLPGSKSNLGPRGAAAGAAADHNQGPPPARGGFAPARGGGRAAARLDSPRPCCC